MLPLFPINVRILFTCVAIVSMYAESNDSPIMSLEEVIGVEIQRTALSVKTQKENNSGGILVGEG